MNFDMLYLPNKVTANKIQYYFKPFDEHKHCYLKALIVIVTVTFLHTVMLQLSARSERNKNEKAHHPRMTPFLPSNNSPTIISRPNIVQGPRIKHFG